ncbi:hypothetical protein CHS0354_035921 [Potamilus streckersoni]|uniref:Citramalyl-CoA lyase, mitochondrial n=1 Tax=Potamilus streckersoni TaxID=2493646 RepID=A0AAE0SG77_9BIVA|nr:hypothetical protein CHS0354_035921 [Potamilus streckersoni]
MVLMKRLYPSIRPISAALSCVLLARGPHYSGNFTHSLPMCSSSDVYPMNRKYVPRRAVLYVPGNDERKLSKIPSLNVDCAVMDCEDGVALNRKVEARETIGRMLGKLNFGRSECCVRFNSVSSGLMEEDIKAVFSAGKLPQTIMVPKVNSVQELQVLSKLLDSSLHDRHIAEKLSLVIFIESAMALLDLKDICRKGVELSIKSKIFSLDGLVFGSDDFCADIGAVRSKDSKELLYARQKIVTTAKAFRLQAIDMVHIDYKDQESLRQQAVEGAGMGYTGKQVIHPSQIEIVQEAFCPNQEKIQWARELIQAFEQHQTSGKGAFTFRGEMIDMPLLLQAKNIVQLAESIQTKS